MRAAQKVLLVVVVLVVVITAGVAGAVLGLRHSDHDGSSTSLAAPTPAPGATTPPAPSLAAFYSQRLSWSPCRRDFQCATLTVPLDYRHPDGRRIKRVLFEDLADGPSTEIGSLVVNPGGPGASGVDYAAAGGFAFGRALREHFDIVGFDPRGVGQSDPVDCLTDGQLDRYLAADPSPDTPAEVASLTGWAKTMAEGCARRSGDIAAHVSTVEAARDMDVLRAALGEAQLDYLGASYGTKLGTTYADLFPAKVGRFVLDGAMDPHVTLKQLDLQQAEGFETALRSYLGHCVDGGGCYLGESVAAGEQRVRQFLAEVDRNPLPTSSGRMLTSGEAFAGLILPLYNRSYWQLLDSALAEGLHGNGSQLLALSDQSSDRGQDGYTNNTIEANWAVNCLDDPTSYTPAQIRKVLPSFVKAAPTFGDSLAWSLGACADQRLHATEKAPPVGAPGANPIVVVGTTRDPATPYQWARSLARELDSGVLVSRDGDGHTGYNSGNRCVDDAVEGYLVDGRVPENGLRC